MMSDGPSKLVSSTHQQTTQAKARAAAAPPEKEPEHEATAVHLSDPPCDEPASEDRTQEQRVKQEQQEQVEEVLARQEREVTQKNVREAAEARHAERLERKKRAEPGREQRKKQPEEGAGERVQVVTTASFQGDMSKNMMTFAKGLSLSLSFCLLLGLYPIHPL